MKRARQQVGDRMPTAEELFRQLSDLLFSCSQELAQTGGANWEKAETFFKLAKSADQLRTSVIRALSGESEEETGNNHATLQNSPRRTRLVGKSHSGRVQKQAYPKYRVRGNLLFKTGLSRDAKKEYEHILPKQDFDAIINLLGELSASRQDFGVEEIRTQLSCPAYQIYTVLSLLKARQILLVPKRGLYSFRTPGAFLAEAASLWEELRTAEPI